MDNDSNVINVKDYYENKNAIGDGITDDTAAIRRAIKIAKASGKAVYFPTGIYRYFPQAGLIEPIDDPENPQQYSKEGPALPISGNVTLLGDGMFNSVLYFEDEYGTGSAGIGGVNVCNLTINALGFKGSWGQGGNWSGGRDKARHLLGVTMLEGELRITDCRFSNSRYMMASIWRGKTAIVTGCQFDRSVADGIRLINFKRVIVANNNFAFINDDCIAVHVTDDLNPAVYDHSICISNNTITDSQGICALGAKNTVIEGNTLVRPHARAIAVGMDTPAISGAAQEGSQVPMNIIIKGNTVSDVFRGKVFSPDTGNIQQYIYIGGVNLHTGSTIIPGKPINGKITPIEPYLYESNLDVNSRIYPGAFSITITDNILTRTLPASSTLENNNSDFFYADYRYGDRYARNGPVSPKILHSDLNCTGINVIGTLTNLLISGNQLTNMGTSISVAVTGSLSLNSDSWNIKISNNTLHGFSEKGVYLNSKMAVEIQNCIFNGDPYFKKSNRLANGRWVAGTGAEHTCIHNNNTGNSVVHAAGNLFKNAASISQGSAFIWGTDNKMMCLPAFSGGEAMNQGIMNFPSGWFSSVGVIIPTDCDPSSENFDAIKSVPGTSGASIPSSGIYYRGFYRRNLVISPITANGQSYYIRGWLRVTNGENHVLGTDWIEDRISIQ